MKLTRLLFALLACVAVAFSSCKKDDSAPEQYTITVTNDTHGTAKATIGELEAPTAEAGTTVTLTATPNKGYALKQWIVESGDASLSPNTTTNPATFTMPATAVRVKAEFEVLFVEINGVKWATRNVDAFGTFAASPEDYGMFYQWNRKKAWPATGSVTDWDSSTPTGDSWESENDPCPTGWRLPTKADQDKLLESGKVTNAWATTPANGCTFTDDVTGKSVFFPAAGLRTDDAGSLSNSGGSGHYWSSSSYSADYADYAWGLTFYGDAFQYAWYRTCGFPVRCVLQ